MGSDYTLWGRIYFMGSDSSAGNQDTLWGRKVLYGVGNTSFRNMYTLWNLLHSSDEYNILSDES